jgi:subtilase family serine protease
MRVRHAVIGLSGAAAVTLIAGALMVAPSALAQQGGADTPAATTVASCAEPTAPHMMQCKSVRRTDIKGALSIAPHVNPAGLGPADLKSAYHLPAGGAGATVAIVDANDHPKAEADLAVYRKQFGLPACTTANGCFRKVNQNGQASPLPKPDEGWAGEIALDIDMVSATCPACRILLVEAKSASDRDLYTAEDTAVKMGAKYVSNSWGGGETTTETSDDTHFNKPGVVFTVSSGDDGTGAEYPSSSKYVTSVGGTSLRKGGGTRGWTESAWKGAGSGCSKYEGKPAAQTVTTGCTRRAASDVSAVADPQTGVAVYASFGANGWSVFGGTSASAPIIAAVYALAGTPGAQDLTSSYPYRHQAGLNDVTSGRNGSCAGPMCNAGKGWDGPTGLGTPNGVAAFKP